jgi:carnitine O-acetyltransferase
MTSDGELTWTLWTATDYLQYTITSRTEMPNKRFIEEIDRAARELYELHDEKARL